MDFDGIDTIAAISTPPGEAGVGIVRLSGPRALGIAEGIFQNPRGRRPRPGRVTYGFIVDPQKQEHIDEVLLLYMKAPHSYTREDVVEVHCHGGLVPLARVLELALDGGARLAEPGEFTRRAFLNGRIDLSQAEATLDIIQARTRAAGRLAQRQLQGALSAKASEISDMVIGACAHVEAHIDFPEEEIEPRTLEQIRDAVSAALDEVSVLVNSYEHGRLYREGMRVAIVGRPNVGKSSLLNRLLMRERAIVTGMPGTTRDVLEEELSIKGIPLVMLDTAGIREALDEAEEEGVRRSLGALEDADVAVVVLDGSEPLMEEDARVLVLTADKNSIVAINKCDLPAAFGPDAIEGRAGLKPSALRVSALTGEGVEELKEALYRSCAGQYSECGVMVTNIRHKLALEGAGRALKAALSSLNGASTQAALPIEITAMELREALDSLGLIAGLVTTDDILNRIFSEFCIGK